MPIYVKIESITGDVTAEGHSGEVQASTLSYGLAAPVAPQVGGGALAAAPPSMSEVSITKGHDVASVPLTRALLKRTRFGTVNITFTRQDSARSADYLRVELIDALVSAINVSSSGDRPEEHITFQCAQARWTDLAVEKGESSVAHDFNAAR